MTSVVLRKQQGSTLLVSMVMLVAITVLVVYAIRSGNTNLRIAANNQAEVEASAATQTAIEERIEEIIDVEDLSLLPQKEVTVATGPAAYRVVVKPMTTCVVEVPILNNTLDGDVPNDRACFADGDGDRALKADGELTTKPSECKSQQWEIAAEVNDGVTGAKVHQVQGITIRVPATVTCL